MQMLVAYFFIFIERFTQSYEHNLALSTGRKIPGQSYTSYLAWEEAERERRKKSEAYEEKWDET